jgi:hypothetical protein
VEEQEEDFFRAQWPVWKKKRIRHSDVKDPETGD